MTQLHGIKLCYKPLEMIMICSSELIWVMVVIIELHACNHS